MNNQRGAAQILAVLLLIAGLGVGVYLIQKPTNILPKAYNRVNNPVSAPIPSSSPTPIPKPSPSCMVTAPSNLSVSNLAPKSAVLRWTPGSGGISQLLRVATTQLGVASGCNSAPCVVKKDHFSTTITSYNTGNVLLPGVTYWWRIVNYKDGNCMKDAISIFTTPSQTIIGSPVPVASPPTSSTLPPGGPLQ